MSQGLATHGAALRASDLVNVARRGGRLSQCCPGGRPTQSMLPGHVGRLRRLRPQGLADFRPSPPPPPFPLLPACHPSSSPSPPPLFPHACSLSRSAWPLRKKRMAIFYADDLRTRILFCPRTFCLCPHNARTGSCRSLYCLHRVVCFCMIIVRRICMYVCLSVCVCVYIRVIWCGSALRLCTIHLLTMGTVVAFLCKMASNADRCETGPVQMCSC